MKKVLNKAIFLLSRRSYFSKELKEKLIHKGFAEKEVIEALNQIKKQGWLKDLELGYRHKEALKKKGYGQKMIFQKLVQKAGKEVADKLDWGKESLEDIQNLTKKRYQKDLPEKREKVIRALLRRGFSLELILQALESQS